MLVGLQADEKPLVVRGGIDGKAFSETGRVYVDDDQLIHFRSSERLYYFSHMYYIWDALAEAEVVVDGKIIEDRPIRITGNYSKAAYVYNFVEEPAMRGSQIMWIDRIEKMARPTEREKTSISLVDGQFHKNWAASSGWVVRDKNISCKVPDEGHEERLTSQSSFTDFELSFEYRCSWGTSASLLLRLNENGGGLALSLDHLDGGTVGFPKFAAGASRPFTLQETREQRGVGQTVHHHIQYDGRVDYDAVAQDKLLECATLNEFLREWDGAFWNIVRVRCVGSDPEVTVWINGFRICKFQASTLVLREENPASVGAMEHHKIEASGRLGFAVHSMNHEEPEFLLREVRVTERVPAEARPAVEDGTQGQ